MNKTTAYLSGPISRTADGNKEGFAFAQRFLEKHDFEVLNPHEICQELHRSQFESDKEFWNACMRACIKSMMDAEVIVMLPGFTSSDGAQMELDMAQRLNFKKIFFAQYYEKQTGLVPPSPKFM